MAVPDRPQDYRVVVNDDDIRQPLAPPTNGVRRGRDQPKNVVSAFSISTEPHSWLQEYNQYRQEHDPPSVGRIQALDADHTAGHGNPQDSSPTIRRLSSQITSYDNWEADEQDLREWTHHVADSDNTKFSDYSYKEYGVPAYMTGDVEKQLSVRDFIEYLVSQHGFRRKDLVFLQSKELDHGLDEIERELDKIKDNQHKKNVIIDIGGETSTPTAETSIVPIRTTTSATTRVVSRRPKKVSRSPATKTKQQGRPTLDVYYYSDDDSDDDEVPRRKLRKNPRKPGKPYRNIQRKGGERNGAAPARAKHWLVFAGSVLIVYGTLL